MSLTLHPGYACLSSIEARGISYGLQKEDILGLTEIQLNIFFRYNRLGLKSSQVRGLSWLDSSSHEEALFHLIISKKIEPTEALARINRLTRLQVTALHQLSFENIKGSDLCGEDWFNDYIHVLVLKKLVKEYNYSAGEAIELMKELTIDEISEIHNSGSLFVSRQRI